MKRFGQEVVLKVRTASGSSVVDTTTDSFDLGGLRVDFHVMNTGGFSRAYIKVYNLNQATITSLLGGGAASKDRYITVETSLHNGPKFPIVDNFFLSNSIDEVQLPDRITTLYCFNDMKKNVFESTVSGLKVEKPTLRRCVDTLLHSTYQAGSSSVTPVKVEYKGFPSKIEDMVPPRPSTQFNGQVGECLGQLAEEHKFQFYTKGNTLSLIYNPSGEQLSLTDWDSEKALTLRDENMRANIKLGPASCEITSNLDGLLDCGTIVDITDLRTAAITGLTQDQLAVGDGVLSGYAGYGKYRIWQVQHMGSNYTDQWQTIALGTAPQTGVAMKTATWFK